MKIARIFKQIIPMILLFMCLAFPLHALESFYVPTGVNHHVPNKAYQGYTLIAPCVTHPGDNYVYLIDMDGNVVNKWFFDKNKERVGSSGTIVDLGQSGSYLMLNILQQYTTSGINVSKTNFWQRPGAPLAGYYYKFVDWKNNVWKTVRHPMHKDISAAEFVNITGADAGRLGDAQYVLDVFNSLSVAKRWQVANQFDYWEHHVPQVIWNKKLNRHTVLMNTNKYYEPSSVIRAGGNPAKSNNPANPFTDNVNCDMISEVDIETGKVVWEWRFWDHMIQNYDETKDNWYQTIADRYYNGNIEEAFYRRYDVNALANQQDNNGPMHDWIHVNRADYSPERGEIIISSRHTSEIYVIDHDGTFDPNDPYTLAASVKGDFLWRFGSPSNYASSDQLGPAGLKARAEHPTLYDAKYSQMWGQHDAQFIRQGLPGAGQIIVLDNGIGRPANIGFSSVLQLNPFDSKGGYVKELDAGYGANIAAIPNFPPQEFNNSIPNGRNVLRPSKLITWSFLPTMGNDFFSAFVGGMQRLPNGNTLINSMNGHVFEVAPNGEIVWEFTSPIHVTGLYTNSHFDGTGAPFRWGVDGSNTFMQHAHRFGADHPFFAGNMLIPQGTITNPITWYGFGFGGPGGVGGGASGSGADSGSGGY